MNNEMEVYLRQLEKAIEGKNKELIMGLYDEINLLDFNEIEDSLLCSYDELTGQGNDVLYS